MVTKMPSRNPFLALPLLAATAACSGPWPEPSVVSREELAADHETWRLEREGKQTIPPGGPVLWVGLWELAEGPNPFGSDPELAIQLPEEDAPPLAGILRLFEGRVRLDPAAADFVLEDGSPVAGEIELDNDRSEKPALLRLGSLGMRIHAERGTDRLWLRAWDEDHPMADSFSLPPYYPVSGEWRVSAKLDPYSEPRVFELADVTQGTVENESPGELLFRMDGREHRLVAFASAASSSYFVSLWDSTALVDTYQGGRYLRVPLADSTGWTTIDFNRAYNPPCVFTPYSVCSLPPPENRLALHIRAGEQRPLDIGY